MKNETLLKALTAAIIGGLSAYSGVLAITLSILVAVMVIDYATGMIKAWFAAQLSSRVGVKGIVKKVCYLLIVAAAAVVDWLIHTMCARFGLQLDTSMYMGLIVTVWLIINELISILENLAVIGVPLPSFLTKVIRKLKVAVENTADNEGGDE